MEEQKLLEVAKQQIKIRLHVGSLTLKTTKVITGSTNAISKHARWKYVFLALPGCLDVAQLYSLRFPQDLEHALFTMLVMPQVSWLVGDPTWGSWGCAAEH